MSADISRNNGYFSLNSIFGALISSIHRFWRNRLVALDDRLGQEGLSPHMARDVGLSDASLIYDSRRRDRGE